jgi:hypothetical protein
VQAGRWQRLSLLSSTFEHFPTNQAKLAKGLNFEDYALSVILRPEKKAAPQLNRRQFNKLFGPLGLFVLSSPALAVNAADGVAGRTVTFRDGSTVSALGQGSWHLSFRSH